MQSSFAVDVIFNMLFAICFDPRTITFFCKHAEVEICKKVERKNRASKAVWNYEVFRLTDKLSRSTSVL